MSSSPSCDLLRACFDGAATGMAVVTPSGYVVAANPAFHAMIGRGSMEEARDTSLPFALDGEAIQAVRAAIRTRGVRRAALSAEEGMELLVRAIPLPSNAEGETLVLTEWRHATGDSAMEDALRESERRLRELQENLPVGVYRANEDGTIQTANPALIAMMGYESFQELEDADIERVWSDPHDRDELIRRLSEEGAVLGYTARLRRKDGSELIGSFDARGTFEQGRLLYFDTIVQDMTERIRAQEELERLARTDVLTGLGNRQWLMTQLVGEMHRAERYGHSLSLMVIDLDHFKKANDTFGHLAGDRVLAATAAVLATALRATDFTGRYGGEEFCVVLPETSSNEAVLVAERIRLNLAETTIELADGATARVTCSIGVAEARHGDVERLIAEADAALYEAKRQGRNRVMLSNPS